MGLSLQPTLTQIRTNLAARVNMARSGNFPANMRPLFDQIITKAHRYIYLQFPWTRLVTRTEVPIVSGTATYDVPDNYHEGTIQLVTVVSADDVAQTDVRPREWKLLYDEMLDIRNANRSTGRPTHWRLIDGAMTVYPTPDDTWAKLVIEGQTREAQLVNDEDRANVDGEALTEYSSILLREHMQLGDTKPARADWLANIMKLRGLYKPAQSYPVASRKSDGPAYWDRPSTPMGYTPYTPDWNPW